ncbi:MAG: bifunctional [glutamate--ammonia ligase]-adenylyl-L-tyrosine phosphorylase/[glutamate--ammonia-ligase] adenylyltransferase, partial [Aeromonas sp.]
LVREPSLLPYLLNALKENDPALSQHHIHYASDLAQNIAAVQDEVKLKQVLRQFRRQAMVVIAAREMLGLASVAESFVHLTQLADALILAARDWLYAKQCTEMGTPTNSTGEAQPLLILGMGKLGGGELNFSSDIDLIFTYPDNGQCVDGRRECDNQAFFIKLGQRLINALHQITVDGFVFRVDMRLRPFGDAGPLAVSFAALEDYYQQHGRNWERYAMVKARVLGEETAASAQLSQLLRPFIYRRYIDFGVIDGLRQMKSMIAAEVRRKGLVGNIKLGAGGIREVEFIVQALQLIRGGREVALRTRHLPAALAALAAAGALPTAICTELLAAYLFLRRTENCLQQIADEQTQTLPTDTLDQARVCAVLGFAGWADFLAELARHAALVRGQFAAIVGGEETNVAPQREQLRVWQDAWQAELDAAALVQLFASELAEKHAAAAPLAQQLLAFKAHYQRRPVGPNGRKALAELMPNLLAQVATQTAPDEVFARVAAVLVAIFTRSAYLQLLVENPAALGQLVRLCAASPLVSEQLARHPILLDELLDPVHLYHPPALDSYGDQLRQFLLRVPQEDSELQMEALRQFKQIALLRIVAADIAGALPLMRVSDHLTFLAEAIIAQVVTLAWQSLTARYGAPPRAADESAGEVHGFAVVAYGKLGGLELGYGSDLDLVFLHRNADSAVTDGAKPIDARQFYLRLAQRILHLFSTRTASGLLYEVDMRLRPSGEAGLLVSAFSAYRDYQLNQAWTWEHQALVRARCIFASADLAAQFKALRSEVLTRPRDKAQLAAEVSAMREKMRTHLLTVDATVFDLKQSPGGMVDIEFIAQFLVLAHSQAQPQLCVWSDNVRIFAAAVAAELLTPMQAEQLTKSYVLIRDAAHRLTLSAHSRKAAADVLAEQRAQVIALWQVLLVN